MVTKKLPTPQITLKNAKDLRTHSTEVEKLIWSKFRNRQFLNLKFRRQHPIPPYIVDFFCEEISLIIELDGGQHNDDADKIRSEFLQSRGYTIFRYWNNDALKNTEGVLEDIMIKIKNIINPAPHPNPLPKGEGVKKVKGV